MKKVLFTLCLMSFVSVFAQVQIRSNQQFFKANELDPSFTKKSVLNLKRGTPQTDIFYPISIGSAVGFISGGGGTWNAYVDFLYPDSSGIVVTTTGGARSIGMHLVGNVFDPRDSNISAYQSPSAPSYSRWTKYTIDSLGIRIGYHRHLDSVKIGSTMVEVVDTVVLQYFNINQMTYIGYKQSGFESYAYPIKTNFNLNTLTSSVSAGGYKLPLRKSDATRDSSTGWVSAFFQVPVGVTINPNGGTNSSFGYSMSFKPMVKASLGDTMFHQPSQNAIVYKKGNYMTYSLFINEDVPANQVRQYTATNNSFFTSKSLKYGLPSNGWTSFIPGNAYFQHQNVFAYYMVTSDNLAVKNSSKEVKVIEVYPNPASGNTQVVLSLNSDKNAPAVITLSDISGKVIKTINADLVNGKNNITISTDSLAKGMYLVNLSGAGFTSSSKLVIE